MPCTVHPSGRGPGVVKLPSSRRSTAKCSAMFHHASVTFDAFDRGNTRAEFANRVAVVSGTVSSGVKGVSRDTYGIGAMGYQGAAGIISLHARLSTGVTQYRSGGNLEQVVA